MTNAIAPIQVQWLFEDDAKRFLTDQGASDEVESQTMQHLPDIGDWVSWAWVANNQPFEVSSRWFTWDSHRKAVVQVSLSLPHAE